MYIVQAVNGALNVFIAGIQVEEGISGPEAAPPTGTTPSLGSWTTSLWSTPAKEEGLEDPSHNQSAGKTGSQPADADSFWSSFFDSPSKKQSLTSTPSAMKKPPSTPSAGSTPKSHLQGKRESGHKVLSRKENKTSVKSPRRQLQTASESKGGQGEPPLSHPPKVSSGDTQEADTSEQTAGQPAPVGEASVSGMIPVQPTPTDTTSLEESGREDPFSNGWQSQPLLSVDAVLGPTTQSGTVGETSESDVRAVRYECSSDKEDAVGTSGSLPDLSAAVSEAVGQVDAAGIEEGERSAGSLTKEQPADASQTIHMEKVLIQVDQPDEAGLKGAGTLPSSEQVKREGDEWDGGWLEQTSTPPEVIPQGGTPEGLPSAAVEYKQDVGINVVDISSSEKDRLSTPSRSSQLGVSEDTDTVNVPSPDHVLQRLLPDSGSVEEGQVHEDGAGFSQVAGHYPLPSPKEDLSAVELGMSGDDPPLVEFQKTEDSQRHDGFEEEQSHTSAHDQQTPGREDIQDGRGNLLEGEDPLDSQLEGNREEQEMEFMTPAAALAPPSTGGSRPDLETQLRSVQEVCVRLYRLLCGKGLPHTHNHLPACLSALMST